LEYGQWRYAFDNSGLNLAYVIGTVALGVVAFSFVSFRQRIVHAGSAYVYIGQTFW